MFRHIAANGRLDCAVMPFHLTIGRGPPRRGTAFVDAQDLTDLFEQVGLEVGALVCHDLARRAKSRKEMVHHRPRRGLCPLTGKGNNFYPLGELVHQHEDMLIPLSRNRQRPDEIDVDLLKGQSRVILDERELVLLVGCLVDITKRTTAKIVLDVRDNN